MEPYTQEFYKSHDAGSRRSAEAIVPIVLGLIKPRSVIDVGCGLGTWLSVFAEFGVKDIFGVDGEHVDRSMLQIADDQFLAADLKKPLPIDAQFDLAICLEVAEHLPKECAKTFVESLTKLSPVILFSAAIPFQGGTGHVNEQWPDYWANQFKDNGYEVIDCVRKKVWQDDNVQWWYAQNTLIFCRRDSVASAYLLKEEFKNTYPAQLSLIHPRKYLELIQVQLAARELARLIPKGDTFIVVDQEQLRESMALGNQAVPFLEHDGQYWGPPADDEIAIRELNRLRQSGAKFLVIVWPAFWWLEYYKEFHRSVLSQYRCVLKNERLVVFELGDVSRKLPMDRPLLDPGRIMKQPRNIRELIPVLDKIRPFTMVGVESLVDLALQVQQVLACSIPGHFVECGVWRGGASFLVAELLRQAGVTDRKVWLFDSFEGLPPPEGIDGLAAMAYSKNTTSSSYHDNCRASLEEVQRTATELGLASYTKFVKGWFDVTLPTHRGRVGTIALLRIDCDWYSSVQCCLDNLYDQVADRGFILLDDYYTWDGCAIAVHEFLGKRGLPDRVESVPSEGCYGYESAVFRKGGFSWNWDYRIRLSGEEIATLVQPNDTFILVDQEMVRKEISAKGRALPFLERDGEYYGAPPDDETAIRELERLSQLGANYIVFAWPAFWWFQHYAGFNRHLRSNFRCILDNERLVVFDLKSKRRWPKLDSSSVHNESEAARIRYAPVRRSEG